MNHTFRPPMARRAHQGSYAQGGYTLVEILVALVIALFLLGGLLTLVSGTRRTNANQTALTQLQDNQRLAMSLLNDVIQHAGYFPDPTLYTPASFVASGSFLATQIITGTHAAGVPDSISVRFLTSGTDGLINCQGVSAAAVHTYTNVFTIDTVNNRLVCAVDGGAPVPLVNGVTDMQILYGVNTAAAAVPGLSPPSDVDTYMDATQVTTASDWFRVTSVRITLTFSNPLCSVQNVGAACQAGQQATVSFTRTIDLMGRTGVVT
jgi:type IV pilus assembly protein PilW